MQRGEKEELLGPKAKGGARIGQAWSQREFQAAGTASAKPRRWDLDGSETGRAGRK